MHRNKKQCLAEQVRRFRARFAQSVGAVLGDVIPQPPLSQWVIEEAGAYRERIYNPFTTLTLFIEQVLGEPASITIALKGTRPFHPHPSPPPSGRGREK